MHKKVVMVVFNNFTHDSRVFKEAQSLIEIGLDVIVVALLDSSTNSYEIQSGIEIRRIALKSYHFVLFRIIKLILYRLSLIPIFFISKLKKFFYGSILKKYLSQTIKEFLFIHVQLKTYLRNGFQKIKKERSNGANKKKNKTSNSNPNYAIKLKQFLKECHRVLTLSEFNLRFYKLIKSFDVKLIHAHDLNTLPGAYLAAQKLGARLIYDSHELYLDRNRIRPYSKIGCMIRTNFERFLIRRADHTITVNPSIANILSKKYSVKVPSVIMNTPVYNTDISNIKMKFLLRNEIGLQDDRFLLIYVGAITFNRGLENLIRALKSLPECHLVLMGYGKDVYKEKLRELAEKCNVHSRFSFYGPVDSNHVTYYVAGADLGVAAIMNVCKSYYYCSPNKIYEYMLAGIPVIASNFPEMEKLIYTYNIGDTFDPKYPSDIARAARRIISNIFEYKSRKKSFQLAAKQNNWENEAKKLKEIYGKMGVC